MRCLSYFQIELKHMNKNYEITAWTLWNSMVDLHKVFANLSETDNDIL